MQIDFNISGFRSLTSYVTEANEWILQDLNL